MPDNDEIPYPDTLNITLPDEYLLAIGKVCFVWGHLEWSVDTAIQKFSGFEMFDARASIVTAHMTWPLKMDILAALVEQLRKQYAHLAKFDDIKPRLKKAQDGRNRIVHAFWGYEEGEASIARLTARGQLKTSTQVVTVADIDRVVDDIGRATAAMIKLVLNK